MAGAASQPATVQVAGRRLRVDLARGASLAIPLRFDGAQPRWFNAPPAHAAPTAVPGFSGSVQSGASCNCATLRITPHCDGTHTECAGHLTRAPLHVSAVAPRTLLPALLLSIVPETAAECGESSDPAPRPEDRLLSAQALARAWPQELSIPPVALVLRTLPNAPDKQQRDYARAPAPYVSREAMSWLVARGIEHLLLDLPSADRADDQGKLCAHRLFFGLPPGSTALREATRTHCTLTELIYVPEELRDGACLVMLQLPDWHGDALPSRPLLYPLEPA